MKKLDAICSGKTKTLYHTDTNDKVICEFRDDATAFNAQKKETFQGKGALNNAINAFIMQHLSANGIATHFIEKLSDNESLVKHLQMMPVECVVRNVAAGSICKRLGVEEGMTLPSPIFEFFYKSDELGDPMINDDHIRAFGWATDEQMQEMKALTFKINDILSKLFDDAGIILVDYKLEFGLIDGKCVLGDEFTPDGCRLWDKQTKQVFDKDIFRKDLGDLLAGYRQVAERLGVTV